MNKSYKRSTLEHDAGEGVYLFENGKNIGGLRIISIDSRTVSIRFCDNRSNLSVRDYCLSKFVDERIQPIPEFYISVNKNKKMFSKEKVSLNYIAPQKYFLKKFP